MKNFTRLFCIKSTRGKTAFIVSVKDNILCISWKSGRYMYPDELKAALGLFLKEYESENGEKVALYERRHRYRFCFREGASGCKDVFIEIDREDGFPERKFIYHESCKNKINWTNCFVYDFLDLLLATGCLKGEEGFYEPKKDPNFKIQVVKPRILDDEEGWTAPWRMPKAVVLLKEK